MNIRARFTSAEIDNARHMIVLQFAKMKHENRLALYGAGRGYRNLLADDGLGDPSGDSGLCLHDDGGVP